MIRDLSPAAWNAPGTVRVGLDVTNTGIQPEPLVLDEWLSAYAVLEDITIDLSSGANSLGAPSANCRFAVVIAPEGNTTAWTVKDPTETGFPQHPEGFAVVAIPASPTFTWYINAASAIAGFRFLFF